MRAFKADVTSHVFRSALSLGAFEKFLAGLWKSGQFNNPEETLATSSLAGLAPAAPRPPAPESEGRVGGGAGEAVSQAIKAAPFRREGRRVKPNDPCPCGSGKKFKKCCGV